MTELVFKSSAYERWRIQLPTAVLGLIASLLGCVGIARSPHEWFGGVNPKWPYVGILAFGLYHLVFVFRTWGTFGRVTADPEGITINQNGAEYKFQWRDVTSCSRVKWGPLISRGSWSHVYWLTYA